MPEVTVRHGFVLWRTVRFQVNYSVFIVVKLIGLVEKPDEWA
jgi:hypothetical protein